MSEHEINRRKFERIDKSYRVEISEFKFPLNRQPKQEVTSADISAGGLSVESSRRFEIGDMVQIKVYIPRLNKFHPGFLKVFESDIGQYVQAIAEVVWTERTPAGKYQLGIRFENMDEDNVTALKNLVTRASF